MRFTRTHMRRDTCENAVIGRLASRSSQSRRLTAALALAVTLTLSLPVAATATPVGSAASGTHGSAASGTHGSAASGTLVGAAKKKPAGPVVKAIPGRTTTTLRWKATKGAKRYLIELTSGRTFTKKTTRKLTTRSTTIRVTGLRKSTAYKVRVTADRGTRTRPSRTITTKTSSAAPARVTAKVTPAGQDAVRITWNKPVRATAVSVTIAPTSAELSAGSARSTKSGLSPWTTTTVVKVPASLRSRIGSTSGHPVFARVVVHNGSARATSPTVSGFAGSPVVRGSAKDLTRVATYNVQLPAITENLRGRRWEDRREAVVRTIVKNRPDVVGLQEADIPYVAPGVRQYKDVEQLVAPHGYAWATTSAEIDAIHRTVKNRSLGAHLIYRTATTELLDSGLVSLKAAAARYDAKARWVDDAGAPDGDRYATWALFRDIDSGRVFYAASAHLKSGETAAVYVQRTSAAGGLDLFLRNLARSQGRPSAPLIILADLNSDNGRHPHGPQERLVAAGYVSGAAAAHRTNIGIPSATSAASGYPARPTVSPHAGMRIDHILVRNGGGIARYVNQVVLTADGRFDERFRGSDHNLQLADVSLKGP
ncbi:endonuclease/exonuclease/phosphatase family protein [Sanguibacter sp. A247]|uniref:endonuclease/exonuclease/phosphatase family protein n=1 Tax=unclassified Sanguibacter TaxID=2645534 RepID=UPI003FD749BF